MVGLSLHPHLHRAMVMSSTLAGEGDQGAAVQSQRCHGGAAGPSLRHVRLCQFRIRRRRSWSGLLLFGLGRSVTSRRAASQRPWFPPAAR